MLGVAWANGLVGADVDDMQRNEEVLGRNLSLCSTSRPAGLGFFPLSLPWALPFLLCLG